jgi:hypothetical protein
VHTVSSIFQSRGIFTVEPARLIPLNRGVSAHLLELQSTGCLPFSPLLLDPSVARIDTTVDVAGELMGAIDSLLVAVFTAGKVSRLKPWAVSGKDPSRIHTDFEYTGPPIDGFSPGPFLAVSLDSDGKNPTTTSRFRITIKVGWAGILSNLDLFPIPGPGTSFSTIERLLLDNVRTRRPMLASFESIRPALGRLLPLSHVPGEDGRVVQLVTGMLGALVTGGHVDEAVFADHVFPALLRVLDNLVTVDQVDRGILDGSVTIDQVDRVAEFLDRLRARLRPLPAAHQEEEERGDGAGEG